MARTPIHPGEHLAEQLEALNMSAAELGRQLNVPTNRITAILKAQRAITGDTALRLGHFFNSNPQFWLNLQAIYDLRLAEQKVGENINRLPTLASRAKRTTATARRVA
jgi:addiction module HigA family antidote